MIPTAHRCLQVQLRSDAAYSVSALTSGRLEDLGYGVGHRLLELLYFRERGSKRDVRLLDILRFIHSTLWRYLFGRQARDLEQSNTVRKDRAHFDVLAAQLVRTAASVKSAAVRRCCIAQADDEYMISDTEVFVNKFISVPKDMGQLNCAAFVAGIVKGVLGGAGFPARWAHQTQSVSARRKVISDHSTN